MKMNEKRIRILFWALAIVLGFFHAFASRHAMNPDGMSYIEIGEAYARGDWAEAINIFWSPLYSWILGAAFFVFNPAPYWEFALVHAVNFFIYIASLLAFSFFLRELVRYRKEQNTVSMNGDADFLPAWALEALGYTLFLISSLRFITLKIVTPDMLVAFFVYLAFGALLYARREREKRLPFVLLGIVLGLGYLAKVALLPVALVLFAVGFFAFPRTSRATLSMVLAIIVFLMVISPFIYILSRSEGRFTFGDAGPLAYSFAVNSSRYHNYVNWQGDEANGMPLHPSRKIFDRPAVFEFSSPIGGTYPLWYNPSYWHEGRRIYVSLQNELSAIISNARSYYRLFLENYSALIVALLALFFAASRRRLFLKQTVSYGIILLPSAAALGMYLLVLVQDRYVGSFTVLFLLAVFVGVKVADSQNLRRLANGLIISSLVMMLGAIGFSSVNDMRDTFSTLVFGESSEAHIHWRIAEGLREKGIVRGDNVAYIGRRFGGLEAFWGHLAGIRVVAELPPEESDLFWAESEEVRKDVVQALTNTGVKAIVLEGPPKGPLWEEWQQIGETSYYIYFPFTLQTSPHL